MKIKTKQVIAALAISTAMWGVVVIPALAQTSTSTTTTLIQQLQRQIADLKTQLDALIEARNQVAQTQRDISGTLKLISQLREGVTSDDVKVLQSLLAAEQSIYPEGLITGFYGRLTTAAVKRFQQKHGLSTVGFVGPKTLEKLNELLNENPISFSGNAPPSASGNKSEHMPCAIVPPGHLIAPGWLRKQNGVAPIVPLCQILPPGIEKKIPPATTTPDTTAPVISSVAAGNLTANSAVITWVTNESADSQVEYGASASYGGATTLDTTRVINHSVTVSGLSASTTYHFRARSRDAAMNLATSSDMTFMTAQLADTTAPVISSLTASGVTANAATVSWTTDEPATGKVYYGTSSPLDLGSASAVNNSALVTSHSFDLAGFVASSTYYYIAESKDAANNTATSTQQSFITTQ